MNKKIALLALLALPAVLRGADPVDVMKELAERARVGTKEIEVRTEEDLQLLKQGPRAAKQLRAMLRRHPRGWPAVRPALRRLPKEADRRDVATRLLDVLVFDRDAESVRLVRETFAQQPELLSPDAQLHLAEEKLVVATMRIRKTLRESEPRFGLVTWAAYLGLRGERSGVGVLHWFVAERAMAQSHLDLWLASAAALHALGEPDHWKIAAAHVARIRKTAPPEFAASLDARIGYFKPVFDGTPVRLAFLREAIERHQISLSGGEKSSPKKS